MSDEDAAEAPAPPEEIALPARPRRPWLRRFAPAALVLAGLGIATAGKKLPHSRDIELRLYDPAKVTRLEVAWFEKGTQTPLQTAAWRFALGSAPTSIPTTLRAADGTYEIEIAIDRDTDRRDERRSIELGSDQMTIPIR